MSRTTHPGPLRSYGKSEHIEIDGVDYYCASQAEKMWLQKVAPGLRAGSVAALQWQPPGFQITYQHTGYTCSDIYKPDAILTWPNGDEWVIEIKRGALHQKAVSRMKRFAQQHVDRHLVLVWFGRMPTKGVAKRRLDMLKPWFHHVWQMR